MPVPRSKSSQKSGSISDGVVPFDEAKALLMAWTRGLTPGLDLSVSEWANQHRRLSASPPSLGGIAPGGWWADAGL